VRRISSWSVYLSRSSSLWSCTPYWNAA